MQWLRNLNRVRVYGQSGLARAMRTPDLSRVAYYDMETLRDEEVRNWDDDSSDTDAVVLGATPSSSGVPAGSYYFDGVAVVVMRNFPLAGTALTFAMWVRCKAPQVMAQTLGGCCDPNPNIGFTFMYCQQNTSDLKWQYAATGSVETATATDFFLGYSELWVHVAVVCDYAAKTVRFYRNGVLHTDAAMLGTPIFPTADRFRPLGAYDTDHNYPLTDGQIDEVQLWVRALSAVEVLDEYAKRPAR